MSFSDSYLLVKTEVENEDFALRGRPPFLPFSRDAAAFASLFTLPPSLPRATAARFFMAIQLSHGDLGTTIATDVLLEYARPPNETIPYQSNP